MQSSPSSNDLVFATYDIIALICPNLKVSDLASLLTVSRGFFRCAVPHIWRQILDAQHLLDLIPTGDSDANKPTQSADLQEDKSRLSRFDLYAPFVKELYLQPSLHKKEPNWHSLSDAVPRRPLLPNLCRLILDILDQQKLWPYNFGTPEDLACVNALICPSLIDIRLPSGLSSWLAPKTASQLLKNIVDIAPQLEVLHVYVHADFDTGNADAAFHAVTPFRNLRALKCTSAMVDCQKLRLLGTLPQLASLQIVSPGDGASDDEDEDPPGDWGLPAHSFPMLRHLSAYELPDSMVVQFWHLTSLVQPLASVGVKLRSETSSETICNICRGSPQMQELSLDLDELDDQTVPAAVIDHIRGLPLQRLRMIGADIDDLTPLISSMANLEYLDIGYTNLTIEDLISIAKYMPKLRFLSSIYLDLDWSWDVKRWDVESQITPSPSTLCLVARFFLSDRFMSWNVLKKNSTMEEFLGTIAQSLCTLWPRGVHCETVRIRNQADEDHLRSLNHKVMALSQPQGLELPSSESCRSGWMYEF